MISFNDILQARERIAGVAHRTPVLTSRQFNELAGGEVFFKAENLQRAGAFKFRGAYNKLASLSEEERRRGVLAYSSGNHAQATALAAKLFGVPAVIVMPHDAPQIKVNGTRGYGAEVVFYNRYSENREGTGEQISRERGLVLVPPFDDPQIMAGQGTAALELMEEVPELDFLLTPCSGCGLLAGCAVAAKHLNPAIRIFGVEPEAANDTWQSKRKGEIVEIPIPKTIADGLQTPSPGKLTFPIVQELVEDILLVSDQELIETMRWMLERMKVLVEPSGAAAAAAVMRRKFDFAGKRVGVVLSGGNVDLTKLSEYLKADGQPTV
ncbi:MAG TPA: threo-3-hydroxy-L-aspartate ammonia-lyase [Blastocatellia bacterium]|nr:threo-3-hydroxy-L-aspartate ammonia-lyase [Blastocatellia bacterium]HMV81946.1 threo-3-hydroxy-L-aspartate ammonia-lyase [Blastocatellia bacterium]HMX24177.1 threo-3-hydroxy-L-aspartate ammonia-lyase [Blastocatellia bacterium]HMY72327.1 threo-3-hydroxy-L-aspartate ammonia-lyase [Blastocatellia bacterium]HMZ16360.1 threo-3-hydroxy-L-aspartate ammonia-lyase [Blastocatellia bacterium]